MNEKIKSNGECVFCKKHFVKASINRHLVKHLTEKEVQGKPEKSFHLKVEPNSSWGSPPYFLSLWIDGNAQMGELDYFLRAIWLECCGHMSSFTDVRKRIGTGGGGFDFFEAEELLAKGKVKQYEDMMEANRGEIPMGRKAKDALHKDQKIEYQYDFGSTTELLITVMGEYNAKAAEKIMLLSRNEPLQLGCDSCGKAKATQICSVCMYDGEAMFCVKCAKKHEKQCDDFADYAAMPVVNSPRMGVCAYEGGIIDIKRDGGLSERSGL